MAGRTRSVGESVGWIAWLILLTAVASLATPASADIVYHYDQLGRLRGMVSGSETIIWTYGATGNVLSVVSQPSSQVAIVAPRTRDSCWASAPAAWAPRAISSCRSRARCCRHRHCGCNRTDSQEHGGTRGH
jgi:hypothetical protein